MVQNKQKIACTGFSEVQLKDAESFNVRRVMSFSCSHWTNK